MTRIKLCGLSRPCDVEAANRLRPDFIGFVFYRPSKRYVSPGTARKLRQQLAPGILAVGVFVDESPENVAALLQSGVIDIAQLHGREDNAYIERLRRLTDKPVIKVLRVKEEADCAAAESSAAEYVLLDSGMGSGETFDWSAVAGVGRPYFLAGGLDAGNVSAAIRALHPFAVDVSSGVETDGFKDSRKMAAFVAAVREEDLNDES